MDKSGAEAFVYAKAAGLLRKSFINQKSSQLFEVNKIDDLWTLLFSSQPPALPEVLLAQEIENEALKRFLSQYINLLDQFDKPDPILIAQLSFYEAENLKEITAALCNGEHECPKLIPIMDYGNKSTSKGKYSKLNYSAWPDLKKITEGTEYAWLDSVPDSHSQQQIEFKIDLQCVQNLWKAISKTDADSKQALLDFYTEEYIIKNIVWVLRLKKYFRLGDEEIKQRLIYVTEAPDKDDPLAGPALRILDKNLEDYSQWENWKYDELLNPHVGGEVWQIEPSWIERKNLVRMNSLAQRLFHLHGMTSAALIGWFYIKDFELRCIRTAVESLRLNISHAEAMSAAGMAE